MVIVYLLMADWPSFSSHRGAFLRQLAQGLPPDALLIAVNRTIDLFITPVLNPQRFRTWLGQGERIRKVGKNFSIFSPVILIHDKLGLVFPLLGRINAAFLRWQVSRTIKWVTGSSRGPLVVFYSHPLQYPFMKFFPNAINVYDCFDDHASFPGKRSFLLKRTERNEERMVRAVDLVFATSQNLCRRFKVWNKNVHFFPNAVDFDFFRSSRSKTAKIRETMGKIPRPIVGFAGTISGYVDLALIHFLARRNPDRSFVLLGPILKYSYDERLFYELHTLPNVYYLGHKEYEELPEYYRAFDACLLPYKKIRWTESVFPNKVFQYLAVGKPVVSIGLPELDVLEGTIALAENYGDYEKRIQDSLDKNNRQLEDDRVRIAAENSWPKRVQELITIVTPLVNRREKDARPS